jgi:hypothetical protein
MSSVKLRGFCSAGGSAVSPGILAPTRMKSVFNAKKGEGKESVWVELSHYIPSSHHLSFPLRLS